MTQPSVFSQILFIVNLVPFLCSSLLISVLGRESQTDAAYSRVESSKDLCVLSLTSLLQWQILLLRKPRVLESLAATAFVQVRSWLIVTPRYFALNLSTISKVCPCKMYNVDTKKNPSLRCLTNIHFFLFLYL